MHRININCYNGQTQNRIKMLLCFHDSFPSKLEPYTIDDIFLYTFSDDTNSLQVLNQTQDQMVNVS